MTRHLPRQSTRSPPALLWAEQLGTLQCPGPPSPAATGPQRRRDAVVPLPAPSRSLVAFPDAPGPPAAATRAAHARSQEPVPAAAPAPQGRTLGDAQLCSRPAAVQLLRSGCVWGRRASAGRDRWVVCTDCSSAARRSPSAWTGAAAAAEEPPSPFPELLGRCSHAGERTDPLLSSAFGSALRSASDIRPPGPGVGGPTGRVTPRNRQPHQGAFVAGSCRPSRSLALCSCARGRACWREQHGTGDKLESETL